MKRSIIRIGETLVTFARTTTQTRPQVNPRDPTKHYRDMYYQSGITHLSKGEKFVLKVAETQPALAANLALKMAVFFYNSRPGDDAYRSNYLAMAKRDLLSGGFSARIFAEKMKDKAQRQALLNQINAQKTAWGF